MRESRFSWFVININIVKTLQASRIEDLKYSKCPIEQLTQHPCYSVNVFFDSSLIAHAILYSNNRLSIEYVTKKASGKCNLDS